MYLFFIITIFTCANNFFNLFWWGKVEGKFNTADVGIIFMLITGIFVVLFNKNKILANRFTFLILFQMVFCLFHIFFVQIRFNYPLSQAIIASRNFLNYFSFFYFILLLDSPSKIYRLMDTLNWIMVVILVLSVINYFHPFFYHEWAEGHYERAGVKRAFIPAMSIISMLGIWSFANMFPTTKRQIKWRGYSFLYIAAHIFRQTRMRLVGLLVVLFCLSIYKRRFTMIVLALVLLGGAAVAINSMLHTDIISGNVSVTLDEISEKKGSWGGRLVFAENIWDELNKSPLYFITGTGGSAIRAYRGAYETIADKQYKQYYVLGKQSDLGYLTWIRDFGLIGIIWLICFFHTVWNYFRKAVVANKQENETLALFSGFFLFFVAGTFVTLNHFVAADEILNVMLAAAILVRLNFGWK